MKTNAICPISINKVDENVARLNATFTVMLLVASALSLSLIPLLILLIDFSLRGAQLSKYSPMTFFSKFTVFSLKIKKKQINAGPKIFAARIGIVFSLAIILSYIFDVQMLALVITGVFAVCAFLESVYGFCVACLIYPYVYRFKYNSKIQKLKI